jgi:transcriptional regulator with XRE-family HTH domain
VNNEGSLDRLRHQVLRRLKEKGATQKELAAHLKITGGALSMMLGAKGDPRRGISIKILDAIGEFFTVPASVLLLDSESDGLPSPPPGGGGGSAHVETGLLARSAEVDRLRTLLAQRDLLIGQQQFVLDHIAENASVFIADVDRLKVATGALEPARAARGGAGQHVRTARVARRRRVRSGGPR